MLRSLSLALIVAQGQAATYYTSSYAAGNLGDTTCPAGSRAMTQGECYAFMGYPGQTSTTVAMRTTMLRAVLPEESHTVHALSHHSVHSSDLAASTVCVCGVFCR